MNIKRLYTCFILLLTFLVSSFVKNNTVESNTEEFIVVLDAGHGGHDPGNLGNGYLEKSIALNIVLKIGSILESHPNIKVIYTRKDDTFVDLFARGEIANKANADLFVSVHCDSHNSDAHGAGTFVLGLHANKQNFEIAKKENSVIYLEDNYETRYSNYDINSPESVIGLTIMQEEFLDQSIVLAKEIQDNFSNQLMRKDRKVKQAGFIVLHQTFMPSVLVETGFLTNDAEGAYLNSEKGQKEMSTAIADAILDYKESVKTNEGSTSDYSSTPTPSLEQAVSSPTISESTAVASQDKKEPIEQVVSKTVVNEPIAPNIEEKTVLPEKNENVVDVIPPRSNKRESIIIFKVQLMASGQKIPLTPQQFNGLNVLSIEQFKQFTRYMYGNAKTYEHAKLLKKNADLKGYEGSYIVAYKDGERISVQKAIKSVSEY